ncbi:unnamed protein product [Vicia faba]|uniref:Uncharacterized protein n=1 Tax=Vicia faba TaxID=3906 RepID=A0AAV1AT94_VICFA|nr:unnamed protein product [Vicia faba]
MRIEELQSSLKTQELCLTERTSEREVEQTLKASFVKNDQNQKKQDRSQKSENNFDHFAKDCWSNKEEETKIARCDSNDELVLLMIYEFDEQPVRFLFSDSEGEEDNIEDSEDELEFEVFKDESGLEDDAEDKSESEGDSESEEELEDESESDGDSTSEDESEPKGSKDESELESSEGESESEDEESSGDSEDESDGESNFNPDFESGGDHASERENSKGVCYGGQAFIYYHVFDGNDDSEGGPSEGGASKGSPTSIGGHIFEGGTSEERASEGDPSFEGGVVLQNFPSHFSSNLSQDLLGFKTAQG